MKSLTLKRLNETLRELRDRFDQTQGDERKANTTLWADLVDAQGYMLGLVKSEPRDPRKILVGLGYE
jgi:hypothetical protein